MTTEVGIEWVSAGMNANMWLAMATEKDSEGRTAETHVGTVGGDRYLGDIPVTFYGWMSIVGDDAAYLKVDSIVVRVRGDEPLPIMNRLVELRAKLKGMMVDL